MDDIVPRFMREHNIPLTRSNYLECAYLGNPPEIDGELEAELQRADTSRCSFSKTFSAPDTNNFSFAVTIKFVSFVFRLHLRIDSARAALRSGSAVSLHVFRRARR